jgi:hypothetical protein
MSTDIAFTLSAAPTETAVPFTVLGTCTGGQKLLQKVILVMLNGSGDPARFAGGNLIGRFTGATVGSDLGRLQGIMQIAIQDTKTLIQAAQALDTTLTDGERLSNIELTKLEQPERDQLNATFTVVTVSGEALQATLTL